MSPFVILPTYATKPSICVDGEIRVGGCKGGVRGGAHSRAAIDRLGEFGEASLLVECFAEFLNEHLVSDGDVVASEELQRRLGVAEEEE